MLLLSDCGSVGVGRHGISCMRHKQRLILVVWMDKRIPNGWLSLVIPLYLDPADSDMNPPTHIDDRSLGVPHDSQTRTIHLLLPLPSMPFGAIEGHVDSGLWIALSCESYNCSRPVKCEGCNIELLVALCQRLHTRNQLQITESAKKESVFG